MYYNMKRYRFNSRRSICFIFWRHLIIHKLRREQLKFRYLIYTWMKMYGHRYRQSCVLLGAGKQKAKLSEALLSYQRLERQRKSVMPLSHTDVWWWWWCFYMWDSWCSPILHCSLDFILLQQMHRQSTALAIQMRKAQGWWTTRIERVLNEVQWTCFTSHFVSPCFLVHVPFCSVVFCHPLSLDCIL